MQIIKTRKEIKLTVLSLKKAGKSIGFVPTMGALHKGHISLVENSVKENNITIVSIFVNPNQFNNKEDLEKYPRNLEKDFQLLRENNVDYVFTPDVNEMYPKKDTRVFDFGNIDKVMEGEHRPGHFNGVAQVVSKLFESISAHSAYFGLKDFQQLAVINELVRQLKIDINIVACPIVREANGLAMSSRNERLTKVQREEAGIIFETLTEIKKLLLSNSVKQIKEKAMAKINGNPLFEVEYLEIVDNKTLESISVWQDGISACIAVFAGNIRLIDNIQLK